MNNLLERFIKRNNKKRGINITVATIVMFLLSCTGIYAATIIEGDVKKYDYTLHLKNVDGTNKYFWTDGTYKYNEKQIDTDNKVIINGNLTSKHSHTLRIDDTIQNLTVENNGNIEGVTIGGNTNQTQTTNAILNNNGIITNNDGNAVIVYSENAKVNNYGIIKATGQNEKTQEYYKGVVLANGGNFNNYGIVIDGDGKISSVGASNQQITMDNGITYTVKNAVDSSSGTAQAIKMNGNLYENYIFNGIDTTISVSKGESGGENKISNSIINVVATKMPGASDYKNNGIEILNGAALKLESTTVNGNIAINGGTLTLTDANNKINGTIQGNGNSDTIGLGYAITDTDSTSLKGIVNSTIENLQLSNFSNTINVTRVKELGFNGKYIGGTGADTFIVDGANYTIDGGDGEDTLSLSTAYNSNLSNFKNISNIETLQLANTTNEITIGSDPVSFTTIKGGTGNDTFVLTGNSGINLIGGSGTNTLKLNNSLESIEYTGVLGAEGEKWNLVVNNLTKDVTLTQGNIKGNIESLKIDTRIETADETTKLVSLLTTYNIENATFNNNQADILTFTGTDVKGTRTFTINQGDTVNMSGNITGNYNFKTVGTFTPTINLSSGTTFAEGSKVTSVDYNGKESGVNFKVTEGALNLGNLTYKGDKLVYEGTNPFVDGYKYTINGNIQLGFVGLTNLESGQKFILNQRNDNIKVNGSISMPSFLKYQDGAFVVKSWDEMNPYGNNNEFLAGTYEDMLSKYGSDSAVKGALDKWSKDALVSYITTGGINQYDFTLTLDGKTYQNTLLTGDNSNISKKFKIIGSSGSITFQNIATSEGLTLAITGGTVNLTDGVSIGGDINFGESSNVNLNVNAYYAGGTASTIKNIIGNGNDSNIKLTHVNITGDSSNGKIDLGAGADILTLNNVGVNSIIGSGKNTIELNQGSNINTIKLEDNTSTLALNSTFNAIEFNNTITVNGGATVKTIDLTESTNGNVTVNSGSASEIKFGTGNNILTYNGGEIKTVDFGSGEGTFYTRADLVGVTIKGDNVKNALVVGDNTRTTKAEGYLTLSGDFSGISNITTNTDTKFASDITLRDNTNVSLGSNSLYLGVDYTSGTGEILSGTNIKVEGGNIVLDTTGVKGNATIELGNIEANSNTTFESSSLGHEIKFGEDGKAIVSIKETIVSDSVANDIIKDFIESGDYEDLMGDMTLEEQEQQLDSLVKEVGNLTYNTPYSYSSILSRKTTEMVNNAIMDSDFTIKKNEWVAFGSVLGSNREMKDYYSGVENINQNIDTDIYGAYVQAEYGYTDNMALGFVVGANKTDSDIGQNSLKGTGAYLGGYSRYDYNNIQLVAGFGYQHNSYDADRTITLLNKTMNYSKSYGNDTLTGYMGAKYTYEISQDLTLEPNIKLNLTHTMQDGISEGKADSMAIKVDEEKTTTLTSEIGTDLVKSIVVTEGKVKVKAGISLMQIISGADSDNMNGKLAKTGSKINITTPDQDKTNVKFKVGAQYEKESGVLYNVEGSYITSSKEKEWVVGAGIGYRF